MADVKISQLTALASASSDVAADVLAIVDTSVPQTKKITIENLVAPITLDKSNSRIGIGESSPGSPLDVKSGEAANTANFNSTSGATNITLESSGSLIGQMEFVSSGTSRLVTRTSASLGFGSNNTTALTLDSSQNATFAGAVSLGTQSSGLIAFNVNRARFQSHENNVADMSVNLAFNGSAWVNDNDSQDSQLLRLYSGQGLTYFVSSAQATPNLVPKFSVDTSGNATFVGDLNVTADGARLFVKSSTNELVSIGRAGSSGDALNQGYIRMKNHSGTNTIALHTAGDSYFNGGQVGIGTDNPAYPLVIEATNPGNIEDIIAIGNKSTNSGTEARMLFTSWTSYANGAIGVSHADSVNGDMKFYTHNGATLGEKMRIKSDGSLTLVEKANAIANSLRFQGLETVGDDEAQNYTMDGTCCIAILANHSSDDAALFFMSYASATITKIADPSNEYDTSATDGKSCIYKSSNSATFTIENKRGGARNMGVAQITVASTV